MPEPQPLEALISRYLDAASLGERSIWLQADIASEAREVYHVTAAQWGSQTGCSAAWVRQLWRAAKAFGDSDRIPDMAFTLHAMAAATDDPRGWAQRAHDEQWSTADMRRALKGDPVLTADEQRAEGERILQRLRKWGEGVPASVRQAVAAKAREWADATS